MCAPWSFFSAQGSSQIDSEQIVIASLTRSNSAGDIGFMSFPQRLNVLLSRARNGLIMIGNIETFSKSRKGREIWIQLFDMLKEGGHIYEGLPVECERHPGRTAVLRGPLDFEKECPDGGCNEPWWVAFCTLWPKLTNGAVIQC